MTVVQHKLQAKQNATYNLLSLLNPSINLWDIPLLIIVDSIDLILTQYLECLFGRQFSLAEPSARRSAGHCKKGASTLPRGGFSRAELEILVWDTLARLVSKESPLQIMMNAVKIDRKS